jgi:hypothetical protein
LEGETEVPIEAKKEKMTSSANKTTSSDEDAVLVETPAGTEEGAGKGKKKKGKK